MIEGLQEFKKRVRRASSHHVHKIRNSWGIYDGYKYYRKNRPKSKEYVLSESQYFAITRQINNIIAENMTLGFSFKMPCRMGQLILKKYETKVTIDEQGNVHDNYPVDWDATLQLWYEDKESYDNKTLVKREEKEIYKFQYDKSSANYNNKSFYEFTINRDLRIKLKQRIKEGAVDTIYSFKKREHVE